VGEYVMKNIVEKMDNETKGLLFQGMVYDYYEFYGYRPYLISSDTTGRQRFFSRTDIVMPDIMCFDENNDLHFIECKSNYTQEENAKFGIRSDLEEGYKNFFKEVYPSVHRNTIYEYSIPTQILFGRFFKYNNKDAFFQTSFMQMQMLSDTSRYVVKDDFGRTVFMYREKSIIDNSYHCEDLNLSFNGEFFENNFFHGNILSRERNNLIFPHKKDFIQYLREVLS